jgi:hypothetical protein
LAAATTSLGNWVKLGEKAKVFANSPPDSRQHFDVWSWARGGASPAPPFLLEMHHVGCIDLRLAASTENPNHYLRIAVQYNALAEAEELSISHGDGDWPFDRFGPMDGVIVPAPSEGPSILASPRLAPMVISDFCPRPRRTGIGLER